MTWLAASDAARSKRVLFVPHRDEILVQALRRNWRRTAILDVENWRRTAIADVGNWRRTAILDVENWCRTPSTVSDSAVAVAAADRHPQRT